MEFRYQDPVGERSLFKRNSIFMKDVTRQGRVSSVGLLLATYNVPFRLWYEGERIINKIISTIVRDKDSLYNTQLHVTFSVSATYVLINRRNGSAISYLGTNNLAEKDRFLLADYRPFTTSQDLKEVITAAVHPSNVQDIMVSPHLTSEWAFSHFETFLINFSADVRDRMKYFATHVKVSNLLVIIN